MRPWMWVVVAVTILVTVVISWQAYRCQTYADRCESARAAQGSPLRAASNVEKKKADDEAARACGNANAYLCRILTPANLPTIYLVILGAGGIIVGIGTLGVIEKQTEASIRADRAWVMVDLEKTPGMGALRGSSRSGGGPERYFVHFSLRCVCSNQGQTAARILEKRCAMIVVSGDDNLLDSPNLDIEIRDPIPHYLKANGDPWRDDWTLEAETLEYPAEGKLFVIYGVVRYRHLFSDEIAQTTFGYSLRFDGKLERLIGKPKYNENS